MATNHAQQNHNVTGRHFFGCWDCWQATAERAEPGLPFAGGSSKEACQNTAASSEPSKDCFHWVVATSHLPIDPALCPPVGTGESSDFG